MTDSRRRSKRKTRWSWSEKFDQSSEFDRFQSRLAYSITAILATTRPKQSAPSPLHHFPPIRRPLFLLPASLYPNRLPCDPSPTEVSNRLAAISRPVVRPSIDPDRVRRHSLPEQPPPRRSTAHSPSPASLPRHPRHSRSPACRPIPFPIQTEAASTRTRKRAASSPQPQANRRRRTSVSARTRSISSSTQTATSPLIRHPAVELDRRWCR